jgi:predicted DNA-binding transcriptional regulator AlpA
MDDQSCASRILRRAEVAEMIGLHPSTMRRLEMRGQFPRRLKITETLIGWRLDEIRAWLAERERAPLPQNRFVEETTPAERTAR